MQMRTCSAPISCELQPLESGSEADDPTGHSGSGAEWAAHAGLFGNASRSNLGRSSSCTGALGSAKGHRSREDSSSQEMVHFDYIPL